jgi:hypothetical protein
MATGAPLWEAEPMFLVRDSSDTLNSAGVTFSFAGDIVKEEG